MVYEGDVSQEFEKGTMGSGLNRDSINNICFR